MLQIPGNEKQALSEVAKSLISSLFAGRGNRGSKVITAQRKKGAPRALGHIRAHAANVLRVVGSKNSELGQASRAQAGHWLAWKR